MGSFSIWHWLIVLVVVVLVFGTKKLSNVGGDLGAAIKSFRKAVKEGDNEEPSDQPTTARSQIEEKGRTVIDGESSREKDRA